MIEMMINMIARIIILMIMISIIMEPVMTIIITLVMIAKQAKYKQKDKGTSLKCWCFISNASYQLCIPSE